MNGIFYEKECDEYKYMYLMHWDSMKEVNFKFSDPHIHRAVEIVICEEGKMMFKSSDSIGKITDHQMLIFNSFDQHYFEWVDDFKGYIMVLSVDFLNDILDSPAYEFNNIIKINDANWDEYSRILNYLFKNNENMSFLEKKANILLLFNLLDSSSLMRNINKNKKQDISTQVFQYIEENYPNKITLKTIAEKMGYSESYFSAKFSEMTGSNLSFVNFLNLYRLRKVNELKKSEQYKNVPIKSIIKMCGFKSNETYYRTLRKKQSSSK